MNESESARVHERARESESESESESERGDAQARCMWRGAAGGRGAGRWGSPAVRSGAAVHVPASNLRSGEARENLARAGQLRMSRAPEA